MTINFSLNTQDYLSYNLFHNMHSPSMRRSMRIQRITGPVLFLLLAFLLPDSKSQFLIYITLFSIAAVLWAVFYPALIKKRIKRNTLRLLREGTPRFLGPCRVTLNETSLDIATHYSSSAYLYAAIDRVALTRTGAVYVYVSSLSAIIIPQHAFETGEQQHAFLELLNEKRQSAAQPSAQEPWQPS